MTYIHIVLPSNHSLVGSLENLRTEGPWFEPPARTIFSPRIYDSHYDRIHSSLTAVHSFSHGNVGKQSVALKEYCMEDWLKRLQKSMYTGCRDITEIILKLALNTIQSFNQSCTNVMLADQLQVAKKLRIVRQFYWPVKSKRGGSAKLVVNFQTKHFGI